MVLFGRKQRRAAVRRLIVMLRLIRETNGWCLRLAMYDIKWQLNLCSMVFRCRHGKLDNAYWWPAIDRRNLCETNACTAIGEHRFRFRTVTNKWYTFRRHHHRPIHFGVVHVCTYAEMCSAQWFPVNKMPKKKEKRKLSFHKLIPYSLYSWWCRSIYWPLMRHEYVVDAFHSLRWHERIGWVCVNGLPTNTMRVHNVATRYTHWADGAVRKVTENIFVNFREKVTQ